MHNLIGTYVNGNVHTSIYDDGTKIRFTDEDEFRFNFAENIDIKICNYCDRNCPYCHENSTIHGKFGDIMNLEFVNTLHPYQEVAIGGGDPTSHPDLIPFLRKLRDLKVISNITINQIHFEQKQELVKQLVRENLIHGIGISLVNPNDHFIQLVKQYDNAVIHLINGIHTSKDFNRLKDENLKILILGYKTLRRGAKFKSHNEELITENSKWLKDNLGEIFNQFEVVSFDNLALEQLDVKNEVSKQVWDECYMGDEGTSTFYIDTVNNQFAQSSTTSINNRHSLLNCVDKMFAQIVSEA